MPFIIIFSTYRQLRNKDLSLHNPHPQQCTFFFLIMFLKFSVANGSSLMFVLRIFLDPKRVVLGGPEFSFDCEVAL